MNADAPLNMELIPMTLVVFHDPMGWLKTVALANMLVMLVMVLAEAADGLEVIEHVDDAVAWANDFIARASG